MKSTARTRLLPISYAAMLFALPLAVIVAETAEPLNVTLRSRRMVADEAKTHAVVEEAAQWQPQRTAVLVVDMWDKHWCQDAARRVTEIAPRMNELVTKLRERGVLVIHCPSECMKFYEDHPARKRAQAAPRSVPPAAKLKNEGPFPIEVVHGGCTDAEPQREVRVWNRQIETMKISDDDAISDSAEEVFNLLLARNIENVIVMGVHTNMCIIARPFAIRAIASRGFNVALVRDMTDSMYSPLGKPHVDHFAGNDLVVEWLEKYLCQTITSDQILGGQPFRFAEDKREPREKPADAAKATDAAQPPGEFAPTSQYEVRSVEGWRVLIDSELLKKEPAMYAEATKLLAHQLHDIARRVPEPALVKLRQVTIWLERNEPHHPCGVYHPEVEWLRSHGMNPDKARCVEIANARNFLEWTRHQPMMVLHELAHAYHDQFIPAGHGNSAILSAFEHAKAAKLYDQVLRSDGKQGRAYGLNNPKEYFAEATEALFGTNDFYPFVAAELQQHDPRIHALATKLWSQAE